MEFVRFMSSAAGRVTRIVAGLVLIIIGALIGGAGWVVAVVGLVPFVAGAVDVCVLAPLFKQPLSGKAVRARVE